MQHLDEGTIHAWLDGALSPAEAERVEAHVASCGVCADAVAEARGLIAASSRILTALDNVPSVKGARGAQGAEGARRGRQFLSTWLVRERIAAVMALVVAGGALAVALSGDRQKFASVEVASEPARVTELAAEAPTLSPVPPSSEARNAAPTVGAAAGRRTPGSSARDRDVAATRPVDAAPLSVLDSTVPTAQAEVAVATPPRTDDTLRLIVADARREEAQALSAEGKSSLAEKLRALPRRSAAAEVSQRFAAPPPATEPSAKGVAAGAALMATAPRLVQEERMTEGGREMWRRIYRVEDVLVTLDERLPDSVDEVRIRGLQSNAAPAAPAVRRDSTPSSTNTLRWTDARGAELTLTGAVSQERLERIKKLLGY